MNLLKNVPYDYSRLANSYVCCLMGPSKPWAEKARFLAIVFFGGFPKNIFRGGKFSCSPLAYLFLFSSLAKMEKTSKISVHLPRKAGISLRF